MNPAILNALEKVVGQEVTKLPVGDHKVAFEVEIKDKVSGETTKINVDGSVNQGVDYDRTATVSVSIYELMAEFANQFGLSGDKALDVVADIMGKQLNKRLSGETVKLAKAIKTKMEDAKSTFANTLPKATVSGRVDVKVNYVAVNSTTHKTIAEGAI